MKPQVESTPDRFIGTREVSQLIRRNRRYVQQMVTSGELKGIRVAPTQFLISHNDVQRWIREQLENAAPTPDTTEATTD